MGNMKTARCGHGKNPRRMVILPSHPRDSLAENCVHVPLRCEMNEDHHRYLGCDLNARWSGWVQIALTGFELYSGKTVSVSFLQSLDVSFQCAGILALRLEFSL